MTHDVTDAETADTFTADVTADVSDAATDADATAVTDVSCAVWSDRVAHTGGAIVGSIAIR